MSLTTRCPACGTLFRVVPDQLKISEGWVRCGRCSEVFDARASLSPHLPVMTEVVETPDVAAADTPDSVGPAEPPSTPIEPDLDESLKHDPVLVPEAQPEPVGQDPGTDGERSAAPAPVPTDLPSVSFMRRARRAAFWRKPAVRWAMGVSSVVLVLTLLGQMAYQQRDLLALRLPGLRPVLVAMCQPLQCQVGMPRRIDAVRIDASNFTRLPPEAFRLQLTLANSDTIPVAMPAIELTLTDTQDQPVLRRVLQPADLGPGTPEALPAAGEWSASVTLTVSPAAAGSITGYRLLAFYP